MKAMTWTLVPSTNDLASEPLHFGLTVMIWCFSSIEPSFATTRKVPLFYSVESSDLR